ncbi:heme-binding domain-containing protein [Stieleria sp. JC731]|uniref:heme-binding domain-containing protein n=1 Tax=Pirellulaceae TaxID=2691357 RepID=UPI001E55F1A9|nr:heme-binding domain-containing protein [Stieleria sp. JC731]MCC9599006.1 heme-binding domain-containing protein [Stieleria sp. JC731]
MRSLPALLIVSLTLCHAFAQQPNLPSTDAESVPENLQDDQLVAWCIVPFDAKKRNPAERAAMLQGLGLKRVAYDWRAEHVAEFETEILEYQKHGIEYFAFWGAHPKAFQLFEKYGLHPQIWQTLPSPAVEGQAAKVAAASKALLPLVEQTRQAKCQLGLYNHGGWGGEPENMVAVCEYLRTHHDADHVGIVYNLHHGHGHLDTFAKSLQLMKPYLLCFNLNGMVAEGDQHGKKILPLGEGDAELRLITDLVESGYQGPVGIIGHTQDDVEQRLQDNLDGLHWLLPQLSGEAPGPRPSLRTYQRPQAKPVLSKPTDADQSSYIAPEYSSELVQTISNLANKTGDRQQGLIAFGNAKAACVSCHRIGDYGGTVGPDLTTVGKQRSTAEIVESVLWPSRLIAKEYVAHAILDDSGNTFQGYVVSEDDQLLVLRDGNGKERNVEIQIDEIEARREIGTLMPDNLAATMTKSDFIDMVRFLKSLGTSESLDADVIDSVMSHAQGHAHTPEEFPYDRAPLNPELHPDWTEQVNRDRVYDFYSKQADYFRQQSIVPSLLAEYPGLDGGSLGHWGNQNDSVWADGRWNQTELGSMIAGIFRDGKQTIARSVCVDLGGPKSTAVCFNPESLTFVAGWENDGKDTSKGFVGFSDHRHGFLSGIAPNGKLIALPKQSPPANADYKGFYRFGDRVLFAYEADSIKYLVEARLADGEVLIDATKWAEHPLAGRLSNAPRQWPATLETEVILGEQKPYAIDSIELPWENPFKALFFCGGHGFLPDGSALVCTMHGDVWKVSGFEYPSKHATWSRFASGLHHPQGMVIDQDGIFVLCRDQVTRLHDLNEDGEADFYECFSNAYETSPAGHDFICGLQRDRDGYFYLASGNQGIVRLSPDGQRAEVIATGFRNPDGLGVLPDGTVTVPCSEGSWTPSSMVCAFKPVEPFAGAGKDIPHFGYRGPINDQSPSLPLVYLPRGIDNSSGGQTYVSSNRWGPLDDQVLHFSFGTGTYYLLLRDEVSGQVQGAAVPLPGEFASGAHRAKFNPHDGQLYVSGMQGWGSYTPDDGSFSRVRYTGDQVQMPVGFHVHRNGVAIQFAQTLDAEFCHEPGNHFVQAWNYRYSSAYGSPEFSTRHLGVRGHDTLAIKSASILDDGKTLFLELPELQPVNQLHMRVQSSAGGFHDLFATVHALDEDRTDIPGYVSSSKKVNPHPIVLDMAMVTRSVPNPYQKKINNARKVVIETATNLSYRTRHFRVRPGEAIALTLRNPDVVPHNWALVKPDALERIGGMADRLISDPDASLRHYVPDSEDVLAYTDVVVPRDEFTVYFRAPKQPGRYPYLCTFPGHWKVMNGEMIVE